MGCDHLRERGAGTLVAAAAGDALGAPFEGGLPPPGWADLAGGGPRDLEPGEWTDDTALTLAVAEVAATGIDLRRDEALDRIGDRFLDWYRAGAPGIGATTRRALSRARSGADLRRAAVALPRRASRSASNGAVMRTAPVALAHLGDDPAMAEAAVGVARLTHPDELAAESCVIWCIAIDRAIREDRIDGAWDALEQLALGAGGGDGWPRLASGLRGASDRMVTPWPACRPRWPLRSRHPARAWPPRCEPRSRSGTTPTPWPVWRVRCWERAGVVARSRPVGEIDCTTGGVIPPMTWSGWRSPSSIAALGVTEAVGVHVLRHERAYDAIGPGTPSHPTHPVVVRG